MKPKNFATWTVVAPFASRKLNPILSSARLRIGLLGAASLVAGYSTPQASAAIVVDGGISAVWAGGIDNTHTLDQATALTANSTFTLTGTTRTALLDGTNGFNSVVGGGLNQNHTVGKLTGLKSTATDITLEFGTSTAGAIRGTVQMSLSGGRSLANVTGDDLWIPEQGNAIAVEGFILRVSTNNGTNWSNWVYNKPSVAYNPDVGTTVALITGYDFVGDFGLSPSATVNLIQISNGNIADRVAGGVNAPWSLGEGIVFLGGVGAPGGAVPLKTGGLDNLAGGALVAGTDKDIPNDKWDADLSYVFYASAVPEPSIAILFGLGALALIRRRR